MAKKKTSYIILMLLTILLILAALSTFIPVASASKECLLGYKAHCSFTPISSIIALVVAGIFCLIKKRFT